MHASKYNLDKVLPKYQQNAKNYFASSGDLSSLLDTTQSLEYEDIKDENRKRIMDKLHKGQRKLLIAEIGHLSNCIKSTDKAIVFYIGAGPGDKAWLITKLFPNVKFVFIDPTRFQIVLDSGQTYADEVNSSNYKSIDITYIGRYAKHNTHPVKYFHNGGEHFGDCPDNGDIFANPNCYDEYIDYIYNSSNRIFINERYASLRASVFAKKLFEARPDYVSIFWSDIRSVSKSKPTGQDIIADNYFNMSMLELCKPDYAMIKFRTPYSKITNLSKGLAVPREADFTIRCTEKLFDIDIATEAAKGNIAFFGGDIHVECWSPRHSTESRLYLTKSQICKNNIKWYNCEEYENSFYHYNEIIRIAGLYENEWVGDVDGMDHHTDCALEGKIWTLYKSISGMDHDELKKFINRIPNYINQDLTSIY